MALIHIGNSDLTSNRNTATFKLNGATSSNVFRVDNSSGTNIFIARGDGNVGIGTSSPEEGLNIESNLKLKIGFSADAFKTILSSNILSFDRGGYSYIDQVNSSGSLSFRINNIERFRVAPTEVVINDTAGNYDTRIEGQTDSNLLFVDASTDRVGIGTNAPSYKLDINGDVNVASGSAYRHNGTAGISGTYTFGGGGTGDIASMTFNGGILTAVTTVP